MASKISGKRPGPSSSLKGRNHWPLMASADQSKSQLRKVSFHFAYRKADAIKEHGSGHHACNCRTSCSEYIALVNESKH